MRWYSLTEDKKGTSGEKPRGDTAGIDIGWRVRGQMLKSESRVTHWRASLGHHSFRMAQSGSRCAG